MTTPSERIRAVLARTDVKRTGKMSTPMATHQPSIFVDEERLAALLISTPRSSGLKPFAPDMRMFGGYQRSKAATAD